MESIYLSYPIVFKYGVHKLKQHNWLMSWGWSINLRRELCSIIITTIDIVTITAITIVNITFNFFFNFNIFTITVIDIDYDWPSKIKLTIKTTVNLPNLKLIISSIQNEKQFN